MVFFSLLAACGGGEKPGAVQVNEDVRVLEPSSLERLTAFSLDHTSGGGELRFQAGDPAVAKLEAGQIMVAAPVGDLAPFGFLQRIESRREEGGAIVFTTRQATLEEAFDQADIVHEIQLRPSDVTSSETRHPGIKLQRSSVQQAASTAYDFTVAFDKVLIDLDDNEETLDDQLRLDGKLDFSAGVEAKIKIGTEYLVVPTLEHLRFVASMKESVDLSITGTLSKTFEEEVEVARYAFGAITVFVGPVPVVFSIELTLTVGAEGKIEARLLATAAQSLEISVGAEYRKNDGWKNLSDFKSDFDFPRPEVTAAGSARAFAKPALGLQLYGLAGPFASSTAFVEVDAELDRDPFWNFRAGVDLGVGFKAELPVIGKLADWSKDFELFRKHLDSSPNTVPTLEVISPQDGRSLEEGDTLTFVVRASDREQQTLPVVVKKGGQQVGTATAQRGEGVAIGLGRPCPGSHQYEVSTQDAKGAVTKKTVTVTVTNRAPTVTVRDDLLTGPFNAGGVLVAFASAKDVSCSSEANTANQGLISWSINGTRLLQQGDTLFHVIPAGTTVGSTLLLKASYDDGIDSADSAIVELPIAAAAPGGNQAPVVRIRRPIAHEQATQYENLALEGVAYDAEDGALTGGSLQWSTRKEGGTWITFPAGTTSFRLTEIYPGNPTPGVIHEVRLTATDTGGLTGTHTITFTETVEG